MPEQLALDHIKTWSNERDVVLDPFMGSGATGKMAILSNRNLIGMTKEEMFKLHSGAVYGKTGMDLVVNNLPNDKFPF